jgi:hypothetical protein
MTAQPATAPLPATLAEVTAWTRSLPPPVVMFNKSHSGSRLLAELVEAAGVFLGARQNESHDSLDLFNLVEYVVERHYPGFRGLREKPQEDDSVLPGLIARVFAAHRAGAQGGAWGWKLCETAYILPLIHHLFPQARYVHLIRDGRDVAFSDHVPPFNPFWQKIYTGSTGFSHWNGLWFGLAGKIAYKLDPLPYNTQHWIESVSVGRRFGAMLGERYLETRYEDLCLDFPGEARRVLRFVGIADPEPAIANLRPRVVAHAVGKHRRRNPLQVWRVLRRARPLLTELGYLPGTGT